MSNTEQTAPAGRVEQTETMDLATAQRVEQERMTRRSALRKLGFGAGLAAFSLLGVDDLARMVGQRMERMAGDNKTAQAVAQEFQHAGIALAAVYLDAYPCSQTNACQGLTDVCDCCTQTAICDQQKCQGAYEISTRGYPSPQQIQQAQQVRTTCMSQSVSDKLHCKEIHGCAPPTSSVY